MNLEKLLEWGGIIIVAFLLLRWVSNAFAMNQDSGLQQTWNPSAYPSYGVGGGVLYFQPQLTSPWYPGGNYYSGRGQRGIRRH
jgi:Flp pilus assembly protein protease CpaA